MCQMHMVMGIVDLEKTCVDLNTYQMQWSNHIITLMQPKVELDLVHPHLMKGHWLFHKISLCLGSWLIHMAKSCLVCIVILVTIKHFSKLNKDNAKVLEENSMIFDKWNSLLCHFLASYHFFFWHIPPHWPHVFRDWCQKIYIWQKSHLVYELNTFNLIVL